MPPTTTATTTTTQPPTTTTTLPEDRRAFVGWWEATDRGQRFLDLRVHADGTFMMWDSASEECRAHGHSDAPATWSGSATFQEVEAPTMAVSGTVTCFPYGAEPTEIGETSGEFRYDDGTDLLEFWFGGARYSRTPVPPAPGGSNPFVGSWEATDSDGTRLTMQIAPDGAMTLLDTRSGGCENMGLMYATWSASDSGFFNAEETPPTFAVVATTLCHPIDSDPVTRTEDGQFNFEYRAATDQVALLLFNEIAFTRVPPAGG